VNAVDPLGLFTFGDVVSAYIAVAITTAKQVAIISASTSQAITVAAAIIGVGLFPGETYAHEDLLLREMNINYEIQDLERQIKEMQKQLEPMLDRFNIEYDWDADPC